MMKLSDEMSAGGARPGWMGYIHVDDVDAMAKRITAEGGTIHREPFEIPGVIRLCVAADPQGAVFVIAKGLVANAPPPLPEGTPGTIGWHELYAEDGSSIFAFYEKLFGWKKDQALDMGPMGTYQLFNAGGPAIGAMMTRPAQVPAPFWNYYINIASVAAAVDTVMAGGGKVAMGPHEVPGGRWVLQCFDPQGAFFALLSPGK
jgi:predicted enzyme related to lactoylglutathione lyase